MKKTGRSLPSWMIKVDNSSDNINNDKNRKNADDKDAANINTDPSFKTKTSGGNALNERAKAQEIMLKFSSYTFDKKKRKFKDISNSKEKKELDTDEECVNHHSSHSQNGENDTRSLFDTDQYEQIQKRLKFDSSFFSDLYERLKGFERVVVLDVETSGFKKNDQILELAAVEYGMNGKRTGLMFHNSVQTRPDVTIEERAREVNGLSDTYLMDSPDTRTVLFNFFQRFLTRNSEKTLIVAHNIAFDMRMLKQDVAYVIQMDESLKDQLILPDKNTTFCTMQTFRKLFGKNYACDLDSICNYFGIDKSERSRLGHSALADALLTAKIFFAEKQLIESQLGIQIDGNTLVEDDLISSHQQSRQSDEHHDGSPENLTWFNHITKFFAKFL